MIENIVKYSTALYFTYIASLMYVQSTIMMFAAFRGCLICPTMLMLLMMISLAHLHTALSFRKIDNRMVAMRGRSSVVVSSSKVIQYDHCANENTVVVL